MADEAFALSPISARATQPREEDYEAIREAFMETSRGRWFLGEYARRNRNADTRMVLDAVARIEANLAEQRPQATDGGLTEALAAIRSAVDEARALASAALDGLALEESLAPVRKRAGVIREIVSRLREIGIDSRICGLVDSQVGAIESGCGQISSADAEAGLRAAFDLIGNRIDAFDDGGPARRPHEENAFPLHSASPRDETPTAGAGQMPTAAAGDPPANDDDAHDEAVLDRIAFEMAAPDPSDADDDGLYPGGAEICVAEPPPAAAPETAPARTSAETPPQAAVVPREGHDRLAPQSAPDPAVEPSLGATLIASGIVRRRDAVTSDPLAPIRRLSQAEKIALFS